MERLAVMDGASGARLCYQHVASCLAENDRRSWSVGPVNERARVK
jgi:hypothetical protein